MVDIIFYCTDVRKKHKQVFNIKAIQTIKLILFISELISTLSIVHVSFLLESLYKNTAGVKGLYFLFEKSYVYIIPLKR